jgi:hypothetical protein
MAGTARPALGSDALTAVIALALATLVVGAPRAWRGRLFGRSQFAVGGGLLYGLVGVALWFGVRVAVGRFTLTPWASFGQFVGFVGVSVAVLCVQLTVPYYLYARWGLLTPLGALFAGSALLVFGLLQVGGESDFLLIYDLVYAPLVLGATAGLALGEGLVRRALVGRGGQSDPP